MGFLNAGSVIDYVGFPVINGFTTAAAVSILTNQLRHILGVTDIDRQWIYTVRDLASSIHKTRWQDFVMGAGCIVLILGLEKVQKECVAPSGGLFSPHISLSLGCIAARHAVHIQCAWAQL
jgi:MFS superfamily sulfate permease-like transporter